MEYVVFINHLDGNTYELFHSKREAQEYLEECGKDDDVEWSALMKCKTISSWTNPNFIGHGN